MVFASIFSGEGGPELAAEWMNWEHAFYCEWSPFQQQLLKHYWPYATSYGDITQTDFTPWRGRIDVLCGGFPCQPFSSQGEQLGADDPRYLVPHTLRAVREIEPVWFVAENVRGLAAPKFGPVFEEICASLEAEGYQVQPFLLPATAVGADHERYRLFFVAYSERQRQSRPRLPRPPRHPAPRFHRQAGWPVHAFQGRAVPHLYRHDDGLPAGLDPQALSRREWSEASNTAHGNAIVPELIFQIFQSIEQYESLTQNN